MGQSMMEQRSRSYKEIEQQQQQQQEQYSEDKDLIRRRITIIKTSWRAVQLGINVKATEIFYERMFTMYPHLRRMFPDEVQHHKLYSAVSVVVDGIEDIDKLVPTIEDLGRRHAKWGVVRAHYDILVECFLWTLQNYIFSFMPNDNAIHWSRDVTDAWEWALKFIGGTMADAAEAAEEEEARIRDHNEAFEYCRRILMEEKELSQSGNGGGGSSKKDAIVQNERLHKKV